MVIFFVFLVLFFPAGWEGGDEWIRAQFKVYLLSLLATEAHGSKSHLVVECYFVARKFDSVYKIIK